MESIVVVGGFTISIVVVGGFYHVYMLSQYLTRQACTGHKRERDGDQYLPLRLYYYIAFTISHTKIKIVTIFYIYVKLNVLMIY